MNEIKVIKTIYANVETQAYDITFTDGTTTSVSRNGNSFLLPNRTVQVNDKNEFIKTMDDKEFWEKIQYQIDEFDKGVEIMLGKRGQR